MQRSFEIKTYTVIGLLHIIIIIIIIIKALGIQSQGFHKFRLVITVTDSVC